MTDAGPSTAQDAPLGERPAEDDLALDVAQARIAAKLFGVESQLLETAISEWRPGRGKNDYELASIPQNLARLVDQPAESLDLLALTHDEVARMLGADHPKVLEIERVEVMFIGDLGRARALQDVACARLARLFPQLRYERNVCEYEAGWLADEAGDARAAATHFAAVTFDRATEPVRAEIASRLAVPASAEAARSLERLAGTATANWD